MELHELKVGQVVEHETGFTAEVVSIDGMYDVTVKVLTSTDRSVKVGRERNAYAHRIKRIITDVEPAKVDNVTMEYNGFKLTTDVQTMGTLLQIIQSYKG